MAVDGATPRRRLFRPSWRLRLLGWYMLLVAVATATSLVVLQSVFTLQSNHSIDSRLTQEIEELRAMSLGLDPVTGEPFGVDSAAVLRAFLAANVPDVNETFVTYLDGVPFLRSVNTPPVRLDLDPELTHRWATVIKPERGTVQTEVGAVDYVAMPLAGGDRPAVFVAAIFSDIERAEALRPVRWAAFAEGFVGLAVAGVLAWMLTARMVRPVSTITETVRAISVQGLDQRVSVSSDDELGRLAATFNDMLDRLDDAFTAQKTFLADAGHELRTPITVIRGHLELIDRNPEDSAATIQVVTEELDRMARMVDDLLTLAQAERPDFLLRRRVDIDDLTTTILRKAALLAPRTWVLDEVALGVVELDDQRVTQALMALADNAVGHTEPDGEIGIGSRCDDGQLRIWVRDTGPGITEDRKALLFQRFQRGASARERSGAGLGLAIVEGIAIAHSGTVEVTGRPGHGATFTLVLPLPQSQEPTA